MQSKALIFVLIFSIVPLVLGHGILVCPKPRDGQGVGNGIKQTPRPPTATQLNSCEGSTAGTPTATYQAGSTITVVWSTTIFHISTPGVRIAVQYPGQQFSDNVLANGVDIGPEGYHSYNVTLPSGRTGNAVLQWMWDSVSDNGYYLECADITVVSTPQPASECRYGGSSNSAASLLVSAAFVIIVLAFGF